MAGVLRLQAMAEVSTRSNLTDTYTYDLENRLTKLTHPSGAVGNSGNYYYGYDSRSRRIIRDERYASGRFKSVLSFSGGLSVIETLMNEIHDFYEDPDQDGRTNFYEYAFGGDPLSGVTASNFTPSYLVTSYHEWAVAAINNRVTAQSIVTHRENSVVLKEETIRGSDMGGGVGGVLYSLRNGQRQFNSYNSRGDVVNTSNDSGSTWQGAYEALGSRTAENGSNPTRQRANTKDEDPTGLLNEGFRYRDLETGIFITRDPLGFVDGPNVYTYVRQNPWTMFDPEGLDMKRAGENLDSALRAIEGMFNRNPSEGMEAGAKLIEAAMEVVDSGIDKISGNPKGGENAVEYAAGFNPVVAAGEVAEQIDEKGVSAAVVTGIVVEKVVGKIPGFKGKGDEIVDSARGVQKKAAAAVERAKNLEKGIPASQLGPSGKPKVHVVKKPTDKQAKDAARQHGKSKPEKHTQDAGQPTHYHGTDSTGEKLKGKDNVHFQKRGEKPNPLKEEKAEP